MTTDITITRKLFEVAVRGEYNGKQNVIQRVRWALSFERDGLSVLAGFETFLNLGELEPFTPIQDLSKEQVLEWAYQQENGDNFIEQNLAYQEAQLNYAKLQAEVVPYSNFPVDLVQRNTFGQQMPVQVL